MKGWTIQPLGWVVLVSLVGLGIFVVVKRFYPPPLPKQEESE